MNIFLALKFFPFVKLSCSKKTFNYLGKILKRHGSDYNELIDFVESKLKDNIEITKVIPYYNISQKIILL